jgi:RNA polymerase sigma factor for flagellar operon FliA
MVETRGLVAEFLPRIRTMVRRMRIRLPASVEAEDLVQAGLVGLLQAARRWSPERGAHREAFLMSRARGAILDELRGMDTLSRGQRRDVRRLREVTRALESELGCPPTVEELAGALGVAPARVVAIEDLAASSRPRSAPREPSCEPEAHARAEVSELSSRVRALCSDLTERARTVLSLYYGEDRSLKEIGHTLGVTESRACQIHCAAVRSRRAALAA